MSTGTALVQDGARLIGAHSILNPLDTDSLQVGFVALNNMMALWLSQGIDIGHVPLETVSDEMAEPGDTRNAIIEQLAIQLAPYFFTGQSVVSADLRSIANRDYRLVKRIYQVLTIPFKVVSATLPKGEGNSKGIDRRVFFGSKASLNDSGEIV